MQSLIVAHYSSWSEADLAQDALLALPSGYLPDVADAVRVTMDDYGDFRLDQRVNLWSVERDTLSLLRLMRWTLFVQPLISILEDSIVIPLHDALDDFGMSPTFARDMQASLHAGAAKIALLSRRENSRFICEQFGLSGTSFVVSPLDSVFDLNLRTAFSAALDALKTHHATSRKSAL